MIECNWIKLCKCGEYKQVSGGTYCVRCGRRLEETEHTALAEQIESLLERWAEENNLRISRVPCVSPYMS